MRLWVAKGSAVSPREQLVTQFVCAIASQELKPGDKLPSTRELARHGWVEQRHGSGVYARAVDGGGAASGDDSTAC